MLTATVSEIKAMVQHNGLCGMPDTLSSIPTTTGKKTVSPVRISRGMKKAGDSSYKVLSSSPWRCV